MSTPTDFRLRAVAADAMAARTTDLILHVGFLDLAKQWRGLADQVEARQEGLAASELEGNIE